MLKCMRVYLLSFSYSGHTHESVQSSYRFKWLDIIRSVHSYVQKLKLVDNVYINA